METAQFVEAEGRRCYLLAGDVTDSKFCDYAMENVVDHFGKLDILVNNAAYQNHQESIQDVTDEQFEKTFRTNIFGYFYMARAALMHIAKGGSIVNTGSITNCVSPGPVWTPLNVADKEPEEVSKHGADTPMKRPGQPEEIAPAYVFFASNVDSSYITGEVMTILGGDTVAG